MASVFFVVLPVFALILSGWATRRIGVLGPHASRELNRFVVYLALPALLFNIVAGAHWRDIWQPGFIAAFGLGAVAVFVATLAWRLAARRTLGDAVIDGLNGAYANTGYVGFPLLLAALGPAALAPTLSATILTVCVLFAISLALMETALQAEPHPGRMALKVASRLARNPLIVAPAVGTAFLGLGLHMPAPVETFIKLLGAAASPCALVALGLFIAEKPEGEAPGMGTTGLLVGTKLVVHPVVTWLLATQVFDLATPLVHAAVLLAALPTGTGPFIVAEFYGREAGVTSRVILVSTIVSLVTVTAYLTLFV